MRPEQHTHTPTKNCSVTVCLAQHIEKWISDFIVQWYDGWSLGLGYSATLHMLSNQFYRPFWLVRLDQRCYRKFLISSSQFISLLSWYILLALIFMKHRHFLTVWLITEWRCSEYICGFENVRYLQNYEICSTVLGYEICTRLTHTCMYVSIWCTERCIFSRPPGTMRLDFDADWLTYLLIYLLTP